MNQMLQSCVSRVSDRGTSAVGMSDSRLKGRKKKRASLTRLVRLDEGNPAPPDLKPAKHEDVLYLLGFPSDVFLVLKGTMFRTLPCLTFLPKAILACLFRSHEDVSHSLKPSTCDAVQAKDMVRASKAM